MSKLEVKEIGPISGETDLKLGQSGGTVTLADGATAIGFGGGEGSIVQTVLGTCSQFMTTNTTEYVPTGLEATITPTKSSSKILVTWNIQASVNNENGFGVGLTRNGEEVWRNKYNGATYTNGVSEIYLYQGPYIFIDEPNTTNPLNYKTLVSENFMLAGPLKLNGYSDAEQYKVETQILLQEIAG